MGLETAVGIGSLLASAAGTGLSMAGAAETQAAENKVAQNQLNAQENFAKKGKQISQNEISQSGAAPAQQKIDQGAGQQLAKYIALQQSPTGGVSSVMNSPVVQATTDNVIGQANQAGARMQGYNTFNNQQRSLEEETGRQLNVLGGQAGAIARAEPAQLSQASTAGAPLQMAGSGVSMLGQLASLFGIYNKLGAFGNTGTGFVNANAAPSVFQVPTSYYNAGSDFVPYY